ncbi:hypothetical protein [uncultured Roseibium sp.]|uniref:hypothetical protein n=1 Tax=uncultured Roseibium sp. TaxID=1936171 RepID=UPI00261FBB28|nr:hypothetical protein [uncultured Roseibium sp.]
MELGFEFGLSIPSAAASAPSLATDNMISSLVISTDGWQATMTIDQAVDGGTYSDLNNVVSPGLELTVLSKSWDEAGVETRLQRKVIATSVIRLPFPNGALLQEMEVAGGLNVVMSLSDRIYSNDTVTAIAAASLFTNNGTGGGGEVNSGGTVAVTNNSALPYYTPQLAWLEEEDQEVTSASWAPKLCVYHRHAQQGRPVRAVQFIASDGTNSVTSTVSTLSTSQFSASGLYANYFQPSWDLSSLTDGEYITVDAIIFPWVGDSFQVSLNGEAYLSGNISTLRAICNIGGTYYTPVYVFIDGIGAGSPDANTNEATARVNPFADISSAAVAAKAENLVQNGWNNLSGVRMKFSAGVTYEGAMSGNMIGAMDKLPIFVSGDDAASRWGDPGIHHTSDNIPRKMVIHDLRLRKNSQLIWMNGNNQSSSLLVAKNCTFELSAGQGAYTAWTLQFGRCQIINCSGGNTGFGTQFTSNVGNTTLVAGCTFSPGTPYNIVACKAEGWRILPTTVLGFPNGSLCMWNYFSKPGNSGPALSLEDTAVGSMGWAAVGNVVEIHGSVGVQAAVYISGDSDVTSITNITESGNTVVGQRTNIAYQDDAIAFVLKDVVSRFSYHWQWNCKSDYFDGGASARTGNWAIRHGVDTGPMAIRAVADGTSYGYSNWLGEALGDAKANTEGPNGHVFGGTSTLTPDWVNDQSSDVVGTGDGDYTPGPLNNLPTIPAGQTEFLVDMWGRSIPTDGTAVVGALQPAT